MYLEAVPHTESRLMRASSVCLLFLLVVRPQFAPAQTSRAANDSNWIAYGRDQTGTRFSPLAQITRDNVRRLTIAWTYRTGEASESTRQPTKFEATPLMVDGTLYLSTPFGRVIALDPA